MKTSTFVKGFRYDVPTYICPDDITDYEKGIVLPERSGEYVAVEKVQKAIEASKKLLDKLTLIHNNDDYAAVWQIAQNHIGPYKGPQYDKEFAELKQALNELEE